MTLRSKFKSSSEKANKGVEIEFRGKDELNSDGSYAVFTLARQSTQNKKWLADVRSFNEKMYEKHGVTGQEKLSDEEKTKRAIELFCNTVLIGWKDFEAEEDSVKTVFSIEKAIEIFSNPDWNDLYERLSTESGRKENFNIDLMDKMSKN